MAEEMTKSELADAISISKSIQSDVDDLLGPPPDGTTSGVTPLLPTSRFRKRGYLIQIVRQINVNYIQACYDGCAVLMRRLIETLLIESYEHKGKQAEILDSKGNYRGLDDIIAHAVGSNGLSLSRDAKRVLPTIKELGDRSAHNRKVLAHRSDIDRVRSDLRLVTDELLHEAGLHTSGSK